MKKIIYHVPESSFGNIKTGRSITAKDSLPTASEMWLILRKAYGNRLVGATLVAVLQDDESCTVQTLTFPGMVE